MMGLKRCPFCGGKAETKSGNLYVDKVVFVKCQKCHARTSFVFVDHPSINVRTGKLDESTRYTEWQAEGKAAKEWNRRAKSKHAHWIINGDWGECSSCHEASKLSVMEHKDYCPACGAYMKGADPRDGES